MAGYNGRTSTGYHSPSSPSWQDPRDQGWQSPVSLGYEVTPAPGWHSPTMPTNQSSNGSGFHNPPLAVHQGPTPTGFQPLPTAEYQTWIPTRQSTSPPAGYSNQQVPRHQSPQQAEHQHTFPIERRFTQSPDHQNLPVPVAQFSPPAELQGHQSPPVHPVANETTAQRSRFSLSSVMPKRPSEQSIPKESKSPQARRETLGGPIPVHNSAQVTARTKSNTSDDVPYDLGKTSGWYRGLNYDTEEMWSNAVRRDCGAVGKCLKAGLNVNHCQWHKAGGVTAYGDVGDVGLKEMGQGARCLADVVAYKNDLKTMRLLIENNVDLSGRSSASFVSTFRTQATYKYNAEERKIVAKNSWTTPLHLACKLGHTEMVSLLLDEGRVDPNIRDAAQRSGLHMAVVGTKLSVAKLLLERGTSVRLADNDNVTPLAAAAAGGKLELVNLFLDNGAIVDAINTFGTTALYAAALIKRFDIVKVLLCRGADIDIRSTDGMSALFTAASTLDVKSMELLLDFGGDIDSRDKNGCTALLRATMAKNVLLMTHLLTLGADIDVADDDGWTPLFAAMLHNEDSIINLLLANGPDVGRTDSYGNTVLHQAALLGATAVVRHILAVKSIHTTNCSQVNILGETPLILAAKHNRSAVVKVLLKYGADPHYVDANGYRALDRAMYWGSHACARHFAQIGMNVDSQAFLAVQQGKNDNPGAGHHEMIIDRTPPQYTVSRKPMNSSSSQMRDLFARTVTWTNLVARMREKQGKPAEDPKPVPKPRKPATLMTSPNAPIANAGAVEEEMEEYISPDPFEACIPKLPASMIINNHLLSLKGGVSKAEVGVAGANLAAGIAGLVLGI